jgi:hypothetical protein
MTRVKPLFFRGVVAHGALVCIDARNFSTKDEWTINNADEKRPT